MLALTQHWVAVVALLGYTALLIHNAYLGRSRSTSVSEYYVGGRRMGGAVLGVSFFATFASTNSYIGHAGKGYVYGAPWLVMVPCMIGFTYLSWRIVAPRMRRFTSAWQALTLPDYLVARFAGSGGANGPNARILRVACGLVIVFSSLLYIVAVFKGAGNLLQLFLGVDYKSAVGITLLVVMLYTSVGGFHSVVRTDVVQGLLMLFGALAIFYCVTQAAGGVGVLWQMQQAPATAPLFSLDAGLPFAVLLGVAFAGSLKLLVDPRQLSRFYGLKDARAVRVGLWTAVLGIAVVQLCLFPVGLYAHQLLTGVTDTDLIMPTLINNSDIFPVWLADLLIVAIVAAAMSSMDSVLLVAASVLFNDLIGPSLNHSLNSGLQNSQRAVRPLRWTRALVVLLAMFGALLALRPPGGIVEMTIFSGSLYAVCFLPAVLLGLHWLRGNITAVLASMTVGVVVLLGWLGLGYSAHLHEVFPALLASLVAYIVCSVRMEAAIQQWPDEPTLESLDGY